MKRSNLFPHFQAHI